MSIEDTDIKLAIDKWLAEASVDDSDGNEGENSDFEFIENEQLFHSVDDNRSHGMLRLADYEMHEWKYIKVSPKSNVGDLSWDFSDYPSAGTRSIKVNFDYYSKHGFNLAGSAYKKVLRLIQSLMFYRVPHLNPAGRVRSYSTLISDAKKVMRIAAFCIEYRVLEEDSGLSINDISQSTIELYINGLDSPSKRWEFAYILKFWQDISRQGFLPVDISLYEELVSKDMVRAYRVQYDAECKSYHPIPMDDYAAIFNYCADMIENYSRDCIWLYHTFKHSIVGAFEDPLKLPLSVSSVSPSSDEGVEKFKCYEPALLNDGSAWWPLRVLDRNSLNSPGEYVPLHHIVSIVTSLIDACCLMILCVTGMRRSELICLQADCLSENAGYWITYTVFKTSIASQGDIKKIPVPKIAADAVRILEELGRESRIYGKHNYLLSKIYKFSYGNHAALCSLEHSCRRVTENIGIEYNIHPHRFRKSLALYIIHQDSRNLEVIRKLFSHASLRMTLKYILSLPGVNEEVKRIIVEENSEILAVVLKAVIDKKVGGIGGKRILKTAEESPILRAKLQNDGKESLSQYIASFLDEGVKLLHRTNLAICLKTPGLTSSTPCDPAEGEHQAKLNPNIFACDPFNCRFAAFVEENVPSLHNEIIFHNNLIKHPYVSDGQRQFSQNRISEAHRRLKEVVGEAADTFLRQVANG